MKKQITVGLELTKGNRYRKVTKLLDGYGHYPSEIKVVMYQVKDGSERFETLEAFERWAAKAV